MELMARFDEQTNINWASKLEEVGARGLRRGGAQDARQDGRGAAPRKGRLRRYAHLGTGNYHPRTARLYTDFGLLTADPKLCEDMDKVFAQLTGWRARASR